MKDLLILGHYVRRMSLLPTNPEATKLFDLTTLGCWVAAFVSLFLVFYIPLKLLGWWAFALPPWLLLVPLFAVTQSFGLSISQAFFVIPAMWLLVSFGIGTTGIIRKSSSLVLLSGLVFVPIPAVVSAYFAAGMLGDGIPSSG